MPDPLLPDVLALTREALIAQPSLIVMVGDRVYDRIPGEPIWPLIVLNDVQIMEREWHTWLARVQVNIWGQGSSQANWAEVRAIGRVLHSVTRSLRGTYAAGTISVAGPLMMLSSGDERTGRARVIVDLELEVNP